jgi:hypothetical protein
MNRIERQLWEEANIQEIAKQSARRRSFGRALSVALVVGIFASLAARPWPASYPDARVNAAAAKTAAAQVRAPQAPTANTRSASTVRRGHFATQTAPRNEDDESEGP